MMLTTGYEDKQMCLLLGAVHYPGLVAITRGFVTTLLARTLFLVTVCQPYTRDAFRSEQGQLLHLCGDKARHDIIVQPHPPTLSPPEASHLLNRSDELRFIMDGSLPLSTLGA